MRLIGHGSAVMTSVWGLVAQVQHDKTLSSRLATGLSPNNDPGISKSGRFL